MPLFKVDSGKCDRDGLCALDCPAHIIEMTDQGPVPVRGAETFCIQCGHCVAVCPKGAFSLETMAPDDCMEIAGKQALDLDQTELFLRSRRSIRRYKTKPVPLDLLKEALTLACCAPPEATANRSGGWLLIVKKRSGPLAGMRLTGCAMR
ncbi:MAG: 4Fe-4S binding protein [Desulfobacterales bacterium]|nr:4Fe-4S binding protein [Desulfobacterales bacterium]